MECLLIVGQILLLRRKFQWVQLLQIPLSFLFGYFTDFWVWVVHFIPFNGYPVQLTMVVVGTLILAFGISLSVVANVVMKFRRGVVQGCFGYHKVNFGNLKVAFDVTCVVVAVVLSLVFFELQIYGTREGTIIAALLTGLFVKVILKGISRPVGNLMTA